MVRRALAAVLLAILGALPGAAQEASPGQVAYMEGIRAFDAGDYARAAARMRSALAEDPREGTARFRYRAQNAEDYFPHLWLGLSLEKLGERDEALRALRESQKQGSVESRPALRRILSSALARLTPPTPVPAPSPAPPPSPEPAALPLEATPAPAAAAGVAPGVRPAPAGATVRPSPATAAAATVPPGSSSATLRAGLRSFFRGEYAAAERLLAPEAGRSPVARVFLAWSLGGRYLLGEPRDATLLARARTEYAEALLAGAPATGEPWVSPAILALFGAESGAR